ncbi:hypothetical protein GCM10020219_074030 [Nonomuraea dietziae]
MRPAIDAGRFGEGGRRVLVVSTNTLVPEVSTPLDQTPGFAALRSRFDGVRSWNELIAPLHPSDWKARVIEVPMISRLVSEALGLDRVEELVVESIAVPPARGPSRGSCATCPITVYSDGLMSYGPTRDPLPAEIFRRVTRLLHLDLVPGLTPLLLSEHGVRPELIDSDAFLEVVNQVAVTAPDMLAGEAGHPRAVPVVARHRHARAGARAARGDAARPGREGTQERGVQAAPAAGSRHHAAAAGQRAGAGCAAGRRGRERARRGGLLGAASRAGRGVLLDGAGHRLALLRAAGRLVRHSAGAGAAHAVREQQQDPATIIDALLPRLSQAGELETPPAVEISELAGAVGYCMQSEAYPELRPVAEAYLSEHGTERYFKRQRLGALGLAPRAGGRAGDAGALARLRRRLARSLS